MHQLRDGDLLNIVTGQFAPILGLQNFWQTKNLSVRIKMDNSAFFKPQAMHKWL
jgi:hypothetical protein